jgi:hypothetical protein
MEPTTGKVSVSVLSALQPILWAGIICGVLDGLSAVVLTVLSGSTPLRLFQYIASGLVGRSAFTAGLVSSALGVALHFTVALGAAAVYYAASRRAPFLNEHAILAGALFGVAVHVFMTFVVVPLSAIGTRRFVWSGSSSFWSSTSSSSVHRSLSRSDTLRGSSANLSKEPAQLSR